MGKFLEAAKKATTLSELMEGRDKITTEDILFQYNGIITVIGADLVNGTGKQGEQTQYPVIIFKEDEKKFLSGGTVLKKIVDSWLSLCDGDIEAMNKGLMEEGGVRIRLEKGKTHGGNNITRCIPLE